MSETTLPDLAAELEGFLGFGPDAGLPPFQRVGLERWHTDTSWRVTAHVDERGAAPAAAVYAWAAYAGGVVRVQTPFRSPVQPSGMQVSFIARIVLGGVPVQVVANLDAEAYALDMAGEAPGVWRCEESQRTGRPCADCARPAVPGPFPAVEDHEARRSRGWLVDA